MKLQNNDYVNGGMLLQDIETLISIHRSISELCEQDGLGDNARFDRETEMAETAINNIRLHGFGQDVIHHIE